MFVEENMSFPVLYLYMHGAISNALTLNDGF